MGGIKPGKAREAFIDLEKLGPESFKDKEDYQNFRKEVVRAYQSFFMPRGYPFNRNNHGQASTQAKHMCQEAAKYFPQEELPKLCQQILRNNGKGKKK